MNFIVRILFSGLMALVPSEDGKQLDVLLLNVDHAYHLSDGTSLPHHTPIVVALAGNCSGDCPTQNLTVARTLYSDKSDSVALDSLAYAATGGAVWELSGSQLTLDKSNASAADLPPLVLRTGTRGSANGQPLAIPTTSLEREDLAWVANLKLIAPNGVTIDPAVLGSNPPAGLIAARFRLRSGNVFTYSVARMGTNVTPVHYKRIDGQGTVAPYSQAVATWVAADIEIDGDGIELVEEKFDGSAGRTMTLTPDTNGKVELAMLNMPPYVPATSVPSTPGPGKHFERYYDLVETPPAVETRRVPFTGSAPGAAEYPQVSWNSIHPQEQLFSELLNRLRLNVGRTMDEQVLCPPTGIPRP
ncbi:MAG TPA: hypothetical protein VND45_03425 [Thermoanaerobaculia bacterium]|jgi:hypothetical protein|nr:hypothetical protein [Thermoanaerobaculia bacterium]